MKKILLIIVTFMALCAFQSSAHQPRDEPLEVGVAHSSMDEGRSIEAAPKSKLVTNPIKVDPLASLAFGGFILGMIGVFLISGGDRKTDRFAVPLFISGVAMLLIACVVLVSNN